MIETPYSRIGNIYSAKHNIFDDNEGVIRVGTPLLFIKNLKNEKALVEDAYGNKWKVDELYLEIDELNSIPNERRLSLYRMEYFINKHCDIFKIFLFLLAIIFGISSLVLVASSLLIKNPIYENKPVFWSMFILGVIISIIFLSLGSAFDFFETSSEVITYMNPINRKELEVLLKNKKIISNPVILNNLKP